MADKANPLHIQTLQRAADVLGGKDKLREYLRVPARSFDAWLAGDESPPMAVFLKAVDVLNSPGAKAAVAARRTARSPEFLSDDFSRSSRKDILEAVLDASIKATRADMGMLQLAGTDGLRIVAQRGFEPAFLEFFAVVSDSHSACGRAMRTGRRVVVPEVARDDGFAGSEAAAVMETAQARAVQSTPIIAASGWLLGVVSTHFREPRAPTDEELSQVDSIARRAAFWLEERAGPPD